MRFRYFIVILAFVMTFGCGKDDRKEDVVQKTILVNQEVVSSENLVEEKDIKTDIVIVKESVPSQEKVFESFPVYTDVGSRDNHYIPSGFMPNGNCLTFNDKWTEKCHGGSTCIKIDYDIQCSREDQKWAGVYWLNPSNNWGKIKGGYDLTGAKKITFWAKGESGGEQINEFTMGGIKGDYPDSDIAVIGPIILTSDWKQYTIDLTDKNLSYVSAGFSWSTSEEVNYDTCTFYLDDIKFE